MPLHAALHGDLLELRRLRLRSWTAGVRCVGAQHPQVRSMTVALQSADGQIRPQLQAVRCRDGRTLNRPGDDAHNLGALTSLRGLQSQIERFNAETALLTRPWAAMSAYPVDLPEPERAMSFAAHLALVQASYAARAARARNLELQVLAVALRTLLAAGELTGAYVIGPRAGRPALAGSDHGDRHVALKSLQQIIDAEDLGGALHAGQQLRANADGVTLLTM